MAVLETNDSMSNLSFESKLEAFLSFDKPNYGNGSSTEF
jgi:hypothetical protein